MISRLSKAIVPLSILIILAASDVLAWLGIIPGKLEAFEFLSTWLAQNGLFFVFLLALLENLAILNVYFPGSIAILTAMSGASGNSLLVVSVWAVVTLGSLLGLATTFLVSKFILQKTGDTVETNATEHLASRHWVAVALASYWHPHVASMTCVLMAQENISFRSFIRISALGNAFWNSVWTTIVLSFGNLFSEGLGGLVLVYVYLVVWSVSQIFRTSGNSNTNRP